MRIHFVTQSDVHSKPVLKTKASGVLQSFESLKNKPPLDIGLHHLLDSGGFVARTRGVEISVVAYSEYINKYDMKFCFNLDTMDVEETARNQIFLEKECPNAYILPIFHFSDWMSHDIALLESMIEKYPYISTGGLVGVQRSQVNTPVHFFDTVFSRTQDKTKVHGLGITSKKYLERYPFYTVDSSTWLSAARYGQKVSTKVSKARHKYHLKTMHWTDFSVAEIQHFLDIEEYATKLWLKRGVSWT